MANDLWQTPPEIYAALDAEFNFRADMAASRESAKCDLFFTEEDDSLSLSWVWEIRSRSTFDPINPWVWLNPPYSNPLPWVIKAIEAQTAMRGIGVVMLLNNDPSVRWFRKALDTVSEIRITTSNDEDKPNYRNGRIAFIDEYGMPNHQNNKGQVIFVFDPHRIGARQTTYVQLDKLIEKGRRILEIEKQIIRNEQVNQSDLAA